MDLRLGLLPHALLAEYLKARVPEGPLQAEACKGLVCWPYRVWELEETDEGEEAEGQRRSRRLRRPLSSDLVAGVVILVGMLRVEGGRLVVLQHEHG